MDIKKEYVDDMKTIIYMNNSENNDKLTNYVEKQNEELKAMRISKIKKFRKQKDAVLTTESGEDKNFVLQLLEGFFATQNPTGN